MQQHSHKKNDEQGLGGLARRCRRQPKVRTVEITSLVSVRSCQVEKTFVQGDLLNYKVVQLDFFGFDEAGGWYD